MISKLKRYRNMAAEDFRKCKDYEHQIDDASRNKNNVIFMKLGGGEEFGSQQSLKTSLD